LTGYAGQFWGFDVAPDGTLLLSGGGGLAYELEPQAVEPLRLTISSSADAVILSWSAAVTDAVIQAATDLKELVLATWIRNRPWRSFKGRIRPQSPSLRAANSTGSADD
jgi:hypothetical protein